MTLRLAAIALALVQLLTSCSSMSREERDQRRAAWNYMESGDYATAAILYQPLAIRHGDAHAQTAYSNEAGRVSRSYVGHTFQLDRGHRSNLIAAR